MRYENGNAEIVNWSPNRIEIITNGDAGEIVLSEIDYPGWFAKVDGYDVQSIPFREIFRSVMVVAGVHKIEFYFRPPWLIAGGIISLLGSFLNNL